MNNKMFEKKNALSTFIRAGCSYDKTYRKMDNKTKRVLITGASGGLGKPVTRKILEDGYPVTALVNPMKKSSREELERYTGNAPSLSIVKGDVLNEQEMEAMVGKLDDLYAGVLLVGGFAMGNVGKATGEDLGKMISLNFTSAFNLAKPILKKLKENGRGRLVMISAKPAVDGGNKDLFAYSIAKAMVVKMAELLNEETKGTGINVGLVAPDMIATPANLERLDNSEHDKLITPEEIAGAISFFLSHQAKRLQKPIFRMYGKS